MAASIALLAVGLVALIVGAELVVRGGARTARRLGVSAMVIGLTVVSIGTSAPELAVGIEAAVDGVGELAVANVVGTNIVNLLLILGLSAALRALPLHSATVRVDLPMMALAGVLLLLLARDGMLTTGDGWLLLALAVAYSWIVLRASRREPADVRSEYDEQAPPASLRHAVRHGAGDAAVLLAGIVLVVLGADWLVHGAEQLARRAGISEVVIGLTIIAIGTSAPELVTTLVSTVRNHRDIAIGNLIGSSVYNIAFILGATAVVAPGRLPVTEPLIRVDLPVMAAVVLVCVPVFITGRRMSRAEGALFVLAYAGYLTYLLATRT